MPRAAQFLSWTKRAPVEPRRKPQTSAPGIRRRVGTVRGIVSEIKTRNAVICTCTRGHGSCVCNPGSPATTTCNPGSPTTAIARRREDVHGDAAVVWTRRRYRPRSITDVPASGPSRGRRFERTNSTDHPETRADSPANATVAGAGRVLLSGQWRLVRFT